MARTAATTLCCALLQASCPFQHVVSSCCASCANKALLLPGLPPIHYLNPPPCSIPPCQVVKLSDAVQPLPKQTTQFVHGVAENFLEVGRKKAQPPQDGKPR